jgi:hypothetical protein
MPAPRLRGRFRKMRAKAGPRAPLRHCDQRGRSEVVPDSRPAGRRPAPIEPRQPGRPISTHMPPAPGLDPRTHPNVSWAGPLSQLEALGWSSAQYSFYVPRRTSHPGKAMSRPRPESSQPSPGRTKPPWRPTSPQPEPAHRRRLHDAGPGMLETPMERKRSPSGPGVAPSDASPRHAIVCPPRHPAPPVRDPLPTGPHADPR